MKSCFINRAYWDRILILTVLKIGIYCFHIQLWFYCDWQHYYVHSMLDTPINAKSSFWSSLIFLHFWMLIYNNKYLHAHLVLFHLWIPLISVVEDELKDCKVVHKVAVIWILAFPLLLHTLSMMAVLHLAKSHDGSHLLRVIQLILSQS